MLYLFIQEIYPGKFKPSLSHRFIHQLEKNNKLLRNYTQNIDTLEREAGITRVIECHGEMQYRVILFQFSRPVFKINSNSSPLTLVA